jgi:hypothetical protein
MFNDISITWLFLIFGAPHVKEALEAVLLANASKEIFEAMKTYVAVSITGNTEANIQLRKIALSQLGDAVQAAQKEL